MATTLAAASSSSSSASRPPLRIDAGQSRRGAVPDADDIDAYDIECVKNVDPLEYYHRHVLDCNPSMDASIASDDDLLDLLRTTKDRQDLKWIEDSGLPLSAHPVPITHPPWEGAFGQYNASTHSFESPSSSISFHAAAATTASTARLPTHADSPDTYWASPQSGSSRSGSGDDDSTSSRSNTQDGSIFSSIGRGAGSSLASTAYGSHESHASTISDKA